MSIALTKLYWLALGLGTMAGVRSVSAFALVSYWASRSSRKRAGTPFSLLASPTASAVLGLAVAGELVADKLPILPDRTDPLPLLGRAGWAGAAGAALFAQEDQPVLAGAAVATLSAVASMHVSFRVRRAMIREFGLSSPISGLVEDTVLIALGLGLSRLR